MTTPFPFVSGNVLTAAQLNAISNWPISTKTASYVLVAADQGSRVVMNSASATTITVNTSLFGVGDVVWIHNIGAGVCTVTAGTATVTSAGSLAVPQWGSGTLYFTSAGVSIFFPSAVTVSAGGLVFISGASFSASSAVNLPANTFSATYANYLLKVTVTAASVDSSTVNVRLRLAGVDDSSAGYSNAGVTYVINAVTIGAANINSGTAWTFTQFNSADRNKVELELLSPQVAADTHFFWKTYGRVGGTQGGGNGSGEFRATTQFDSLTLYPGSGTITGSYKVYGYANS